MVVLVYIPLKLIHKSNLHSSCGKDMLQVEYHLLKRCIIQCRSCKKALSLLQRGQTSLDATQDAVTSLEVDGCLNAGW